MQSRSTSSSRSRLAVGRSASPTSNSLNDMDNSELTPPLPLFNSSAYRFPDSWESLLAPLHPHPGRIDPAEFESKPFAPSSPIVFRSTGYPCDNGVYQYHSQDEILDEHWKQLAAFPGVPLEGCYAPVSRVATHSETPFAPVPLPADIDGWAHAQYGQSPQGNESDPRRTIVPSSSPSSSSTTSSNSSMSRTRKPQIRINTQVQLLDTTYRPSQTHLRPAHSCQLHRVDVQTSWVSEAMGLDCGIFGSPAPGEGASCVTPMINLDFLDSEDEFDSVVMGKGQWQQKNEDVRVGRRRCLVINPDYNCGSEGD